MRKEIAKALSIAAVLVGFLIGRAALAHDEPRVRVAGATLQTLEQQLLDPQQGLARGDAAFEARFQDLSLTAADQPRLIQDISSLNRIPEGSRVSLRGQIDGQPFRAEVRNHEGQLEVIMRGVRFGSQQEAQSFLDSLGQNGAERIRVRGAIDGQRFDARFRDHNGRVEQRFRITEPRSGSPITSARGRTEFVGSSRGGPEGFVSSGNGIRGDTERGLNPVGDRSGRGESGGHSGHGGSGRR